MIEVCNLTKKFDSFTALDNLSIDVEKGSIYGLVGPNGAGKTTLMQTIMGVYKANGGKVLVDKQDIYENTKIKDRMIYIPDDLYFFNNFSIKQMRDLFKKVYSNWNEARFIKLQEVFGIDINRNANRLSKGMKKQVAIWLAMATMPEIIILDEPLDGIDPIMRRKVLNIIMQDVAERQTTILISSHNLRELEDICDHVGILNNGKLVLQRKLDDMKSEIHKIQVAFKDSIFPEEIEKKFKVLHKTQIGNVHSVILTGEKEGIEKEISKYNPLILDLIPLTLEEIFIYELGGEGYEIKNIIM